MHGVVRQLAEQSGQSRSDGYGSFWRAKLGRDDDRILRCRDAGGHEHERILHSEETCRRPNHQRSVVGQVGNLPPIENRPVAGSGMRWRTESVVETIKFV